MNGKHKGSVASALMLLVVALAASSMGTYFYERYQSAGDAVNAAGDEQPASTSPDSLASEKADSMATSAVGLKADEAHASTSESSMVFSHVPTSSGHIERW